MDIYLDQNSEGKRMAHVEKLPDHALEAIAKQVGRLYPSLDNSVTQVQPPAALTETFPIWILPTDAIDTGKDNLLELAQDTHRWHSQILIDGKPEGWRALQFPLMEMFHVG